MGLLLYCHHLNLGVGHVRQNVETRTMWPWWCLASSIGVLSGFSEVRAMVVHMQGLGFATWDHLLACYHIFRIRIIFPSLNILSVFNCYFLSVYKTGIIRSLKFDGTHYKIVCTCCFSGEKIFAVFISFVLIVLVNLNCSLCIILPWLNTSFPFKFISALIFLILFNY